MTNVAPEMGKLNEEFTAVAGNKSFNLPKNNKEDPNGIHTKLQEIRELPDSFNLRDLGFIRAQGIASSFSANGIKIKRTADGHVLPVRNLNASERASAALSSLGQALLDAAALIPFAGAAAFLYSIGQRQHLIISDTKSTSKAALKGLLRAFIEAKATQVGVFVDLTDPATNPTSLKNQLRSQIVLRY